MMRNHPFTWSAISYWYDIVISSLCIIIALFGFYKYFWFGGDLITLFTLFFLLFVGLGGIWARYEPDPDDPTSATYIFTRKFRREIKDIEKESNK